MLVVAAPAFALYDNNSENATATATTGNNTNTNNATGGAGGRADSDASSSAGNVSGFGNSAYSPEANSNSTNVNTPIANSTQGQMMGQGQLGIVGQEQGNDQEVNIAGDETKTKVYANTWPALSGGVGVSQANAYSIFGGLGVNSTEEYKVTIEKIMIIDTLKSLDYLTADEAKIEVLAALKQLKYTTNDKRMLGVLWKTSGRNLLNGLGLLSWDSFWSGNEKVKDKTTDESIVGNAGYVN